MKWLDTPIGSPILVWLTVGFFLAASIATFDLRLTQAKRDGTVPADEPMLPQWIGGIGWLHWILGLTILLLNWKYGLAVFILQFMLKVLPVLETVGNVLMAPFRPRRKADVDKRR